MTKEDEEFYQSLEQKRFELCDRLKQELIDRKFKRAYNQFIALNKLKEVQYTVNNLRKR